MKKKNSFYTGMFGGGIIVAIFLILMLSMNLFNYRIQIIKIHINTSHVSDSINSPDADSLYSLKDKMQEHLLFQLKNDKTILTPQEYTNNIVNYYNAILLILSVMLAAFSALSFIYLKSQSKDLIQDTLQSEEFQEDVGNKLLGKAESYFRDDLSGIEERIKRIEDRDAERIEKDIDNNNDKKEIV